MSSFRSFSDLTHKAGDTIFLPYPVEVLKDAKQGDIVLFDGCHWKIADIKTRFEADGYDYDFTVLEWIGCL